MNDINCPHCGKIVHIDEAVRHQLEKTILKETEVRQKEELEKAKIEVEKQAQKKFEEEKQKETEKNNKEKLELEKKLEENSKLLEKSIEKAKIDALKQASETSRLEKKEFEKKLSDMQKALEEAQRKGKQGSQQLQGEVLELDLEEKLKKTFPTDEFVPIPKGVEGADIWQKVKFQGKEMGSIIWETKRTKDWRPIWLGKLKEDSARVNASEAIIVSQILPDGIEDFDRKDGIWITNYEHALSIARYVRFLITSLSKVKSSANQTDEDLIKIRNYMLSDAFAHRMHTHLNAVKNLRDMLVTEQRTSTLRWTRQQKQIDKLDSNILNFYGELKDIVPSLRELEEIEINMIDSGDDNDQESLI